MNEFDRKFLQCSQATDKVECILEVDPDLDMKKAKEIAHQLEITLLTNEILEKGRKKYADSHHFTWPKIIITFIIVTIIICIILIYTEWKYIMEPLNQKKLSWMRLILISASIGILITAFVIHIQ